MKSILNITSLLEEAQKTALYQKLIDQLNKDFNYANSPLSLEDEVSPLQLKEKIQSIVFQLITNNFEKYLNLLYIIDVPERDIKKLKGDDVSVLSQQICFLILKREWQKVWYKNQY